MPRTNHRETGFTLIELLIVVVVIGILAAIAVPVYHGQRAKAHDAQARAHGRNIVTAVESALHDTPAGHISSDEHNILVDGVAREPVPSSQGTGWSVVGTPGRYCVYVWSTLGGEFTEDDPLGYDSTTGVWAMDIPACGFVPGPGMPGGPGGSVPQPPTP